MDVPPPVPTHRDATVDVLHGLTVADPFRWLEAGEDPEVRAWTAAQNERTRLALDPLPGRDRFRARLTDLFGVHMVVGARVAGARLFTVERGLGRDQAALLVRSATDPAEEARVLVDPQVLLDDETAALDWYEPSPDGRLVAFGTSTGGDERSTLRLLDVATTALTGDEIPHTRAASVAWLHDGSAFAYTRYPDPASVPAEERMYGRTVWWHVVGDGPDADELVFDDLPDPTAWTDVSISRDGRHLLLHVARGWDRNDVHIVDRSTRQRTRVAEGLHAVSGFEVVGGRLLGTTTLDAPRGRVVVADIDHPGPEHWRTIVHEGRSVIDGFVATAGSLLVRSTRGAASRLDHYDLDGGEHRDVALPGLVSIGGLDGSDERDEAWLSVSSFARPPAIFRWTPERVEPWVSGDPTVDADRFVVERVRYPSTDGAEVGMFLVRASTTVPGPGTPTILGGYGGFAIASGPDYSATAVAHCEAGGVWAVAGIRGGSEEGEDWHRAGMRERKQQVFDDFGAAADWLVTEGRTSRSQLGLRGGSNGGLLVAAALTQRPDLCRAVHCAVPLTDMVRFPRFLIARLWIPEYGDPDVAEELAWLHAYSPYHHVVDDTCYPAVLVTTGEEDSRVDPFHARKFAAAVQASTSCGDAHPVLLRVEARAGHGQGKPAGRQADEAADVLAFFADQLVDPDGG